MQVPYDRCFQSVQVPTLQSGGGKILEASSRIIVQNKVSHEHLRNTTLCVLIVSSPWSVPHCFRPVPREKSIHSCTLRQREAGKNVSSV